MTDFIWKNIAFFRKKKGLSQEDLADQLEISRSAIGSYEEGRSHPKISLLIKIADSFEITIDDLIRIDFKKEANDKKNNEQS